MRLMISGNAPWRGSTIGIRVNGNENTGTIQGAVGARTGKVFVAAMTDGYPWQGLVDEMGKWNRALTPAEMDALYNGGSGMTLP